MAKTTNYKPNKGNEQFTRFNGKTVAYTPMSEQEKEDHMSKMIKSWKSGKVKVPLPSDLNPSGRYTKI